MNSLRRALAFFATSKESTALILRPYSSATTRRRSKSIPPPPTITAAAPEIPKPTEIPFQPKVANAVNIIGQVRMPVQFQTCPDGKTYAATVITRQESHTSHFLWIPVIFEGDLAHSASCHLKENDFIYVAGQLITDPPRLGVNQAQSNNNIQVMVQSLNFVQGYPQLENISATSNQEKTANLDSDELDINPIRKDIHSFQSEDEEEHATDKSWKDLLSNPDEWWDVRPKKENPKGAAFERKTNGELLFINDTTPKWLQRTLDLVTIDVKPEVKHSTTDVKKGPSSWFDSWKDLLNNPKEWSDFRGSKLNGLVKPKYPDFKRKDGSVALWINQAPQWVLSKLKELEFDAPAVKSRQPAVKSRQPADTKGLESWNDLVKNPDKWWDNRSDKKNGKSPDFKHKETGEGLWLDTSPSWVTSKLPPIKPKQSGGFGRKQTLDS